MSQDDSQADSSEARTENDSRKIRSPCLDAHHEAFILRSSWTVGNLYAANLHLGQSYVKQVKDLEKQRKVWLSRKEKEQEAMLRRFEALKKRAKNSYHSDSLSQVKDSEVERALGHNVRKSRQRATTVGTCSQVASLEKLGSLAEREHFKNHRSTSQPAGTGLIVVTKDNSVHDPFGFQKHGTLPRTRSMPNARRSMACAFASSSHSGGALRRTLSVLPSSIKSPRYFATEPERNLTANSHLIPRWLPSNLRSQNIREKSFM